MPSFLDLPPKLRNWIYEYLGSEMPAKTFKLVRIVEGTIISHSLARTCRQLKTECAPIFGPYYLQEYHTIETIQATVADFKFGNLRGVLESIVKIQQLQSSPFEKIKLRVVQVTVELTAPAKDDLDALRTWLNRYKDPKMQVVDFQYTVRFTPQRYDARWANALCNQVRWLSLLVTEERHLIWEAMGAAVGHLKGELGQSY
ncbi:hypothetical protein LTR85_010794 [Meristemomyces frigidus]|nr:hypothetical protein LTR85_010794 [Meristemomyces frigidus]